MPGLAAKPVIDILLAAPTELVSRRTPLRWRPPGYVLRIREPDWFEHRLFTGPDTTINLHVFTVGAAEIDRMLLFRDRLRANDADRDAYLQVKRDLARRTWRHVQHYADSKTAIVQQIMARAPARRVSRTSPASTPSTQQPLAFAFDSDARDRRGRGSDICRYPGRERTEHLVLTRFRE